LQDNLLRLLQEHPQLAVFISLAFSIVVAVIGVLPSVFITAANIVFFGFWNGMWISFLGEAIGAGVAFLLYRKGLKKMAEKTLYRYPSAVKLMNATGAKAFFLVFSCRLLPFVPSGLVSFAAAVGKTSFMIFFVASSLGKLPALLMEAGSVYEIARFNWPGKIILLVLAAGLLYVTLKQGRKKA
jgi:uncharacterized membrane protein YdjX (TVP38/TMEM64 family)